MPMRSIFVTILLVLSSEHASAEPISRSVALLVEGLDEPDAARCGVREGDVRLRATSIASKAQWTVSEDAYDYLAISTIATHLKQVNLCAIATTVAIKRSLAAPGGRLLMGDTVSASTLVVAGAGEAGRDALSAVEDLVKNAIAGAEERGL